MSKKSRDLEIGVRGHSRSLKVVPCDRACMVSYYCSIVTLSQKCTVLSYMTCKYTMTLKPELEVTQGHYTIPSCTHDFLLTSIVTIGLSRTVSEINGDFRRKSHENRQFSLRPVYLMPPLKGFPLELGIGAGVGRN